MGMMFHIHKWSKWVDVPVIHDSPPFRLAPKLMGGQERRFKGRNKKELRLT
jgi:hypothetical protein